jgi:8-oxo-dGTP diphosphatase
MYMQAVKSKQSERENINTWLTQIEFDHRLAMSVDCVIFGYTNKDLYVATIKCDMPPYEGMPSLVGDLLHANEDLDSAAKRIVEERTGLKNVYLEQVKTFSKLGRHPLGRVITVAYYSLLKIDDYNQITSHESPLVWKKVSGVKKMAFDHFEILTECLAQLQSHMKEQPVGFNLLPKKFTLAQIQELYEVVLKVELDKRNFRRKLLALDILKDLEETEVYVKHRPARLYSFDRSKYEKNHANGFFL